MIGDILKFWGAFALAGIAWWVILHPWSLLVLVLLLVTCL